MRYCLAIDVGASSGRHIVGWMEDGELKTREVYRFPNGVTERDGHLTWDVDTLLYHVKTGIERALERFGSIESLSIDTWGCDYVLLRGDEAVRPCYAYRDHRTEAIHEEVHAGIPFPELYRRTGCQFQLFNTIYQLCADREAGRLEGVTDFLMIPEYLLYKLTGVKVKEYTNATTTGLVNAGSGEFDPEITDALGLPRQLFPKLRQPGAEIGSYKGIRVLLCATHDTASAVEGIPMEGRHKDFPQGGRSPSAQTGADEGCADDANAPYLSSGTWSLLGVKTAKPITTAASMEGNWSNEGGVGYNRYQKNIMGMWLVNRLRAELCPKKPWDEIIAEAEASRFDGTVDANDAIFLAPRSMREAFDLALGGAVREDTAHFSITNLSPEMPAAQNKSCQKLKTADYFRCAYRSLALSYRKALNELERNTGKHYETLYVVGGGAKNQFLNRLTEEAAGKQVIALPIEATALGNLKIQMEAVQ